MPDTTLSDETREQLRACGWPDEKIEAAAARRRQGAGDRAELEERARIARDAWVTAAAAAQRALILEAAAIDPDLDAVQWDTWCDKDMLVVDVFALDADRGPLSDETADELLSGSLDEVGLSALAGLEYAEPHGVVSVDAARAWAERDQVAS